jgi:hypothetical protein
MRELGAVLVHVIPFRTTSVPTRTYPTRRPRPAGLHRRPAGIKVVGDITFVSAWSGQVYVTFDVGLRAAWSCGPSSLRTPPALRCVTIAESPVPLPRKVAGRPAGTGAGDCWSRLSLARRRPHPNW